MQIKSEMKQEVYNSKQELDNNTLNTTEAGGTAINGTGQACPKNVSNG